MIGFEDLRTCGQASGAQNSFKIPTKHRLFEAKIRIGETTLINKDLGIENMECLTLYLVEIVLGSDFVTK